MLIIVVLWFMDKKRIDGTNITILILNFQVGQLC